MTSLLMSVIHMCARVLSVKKWEKNMESIKTMSADNKKIVPRHNSTIKSIWLQIYKQFDQIDDLPIK